MKHCPLAFPRRLRLVTSGCSLLVAGLLVSGSTLAGTLVRFEQPEAYELRAHGLVVERPIEVRIDAVGLSSSSSGHWNWFGLGPKQSKDDALAVYGWLLDSTTREPVWVMRKADTDPVEDGGRLREIQTDLRLEPGRYEVYWFSGNRGVDQAHGVTDGDRETSRSWWERLAFGETYVSAQLERDLSSCFLEISVDGKSQRELQTFEVTGDLPDALVQLHRIGDGEMAAAGFSLQRPARLRAYGFMEHSPNSKRAADYAWIVDAATRRRVWDSSAGGTQGTGGGAKNRKIDEPISLDAGRYVLYFGSDDSHSLDSFNVNPPYDPFNWGVSLLPEPGSSLTSLARFDPVLPAALVSVEQSGNDSFFERRFRLRSKAQIHVQALGEYDDDDGAFYDYAWISDSSGQIAWNMTKENTHGAGGSDKNRMFDGLVELPAGDYVLYYLSDGTHSFEEWNAGAPFRPEAWGVSLRSGPGSAAADFELLAATPPQRNPDVLAELLRLSNDERRHARFDLARAARVSIYAIGEGQRGEMYDYGFIVDTGTGERIWQMNWDGTVHAGGADKNRMFRGEIELDPGSYEAVFVTDDSHAFGGWNAAGPTDPVHWGMVIRQVAGQLHSRVRKHAYPSGNRLR